MAHARTLVPALAAFGFALAACGDPSDPPAGPAVTLSVTPPGLYLFVGAVDTLDVALLNQDGESVGGTVSWSTSDPAVVTVENGIITARGEGTARIDATFEDLEDHVTVVVDAPLSLAMPMGGVMNADWYVTNYVDLVSVGLRDYGCGQRTYDGHQGVDLVLPSFAAMDVGVAVLAAADGVVTWTHDGEYDRNRDWQSGGQWNAVGIDHGNGIEAWYGHLMRNSIRVAPEDVVEAGDTLGLVGSSGRSDMPHLHFELRHRNAALDPFAGPCGEKVGQWAAPIPYQDEFRLIDAGVTTEVLQNDLVKVKDPPVPAATVARGTTLYAWVHYHNVRSGDRTRWTFRRPDGGVHAEWSFTHSASYSMSWWWYAVPTESFDPPGTWTVEFRHGGDLVASRSFVLTDAALPMPGDGPVPGLVSGGGGIR